MEYLQNLNENQYKAVTTNAKRCLVIAGAGSGKTKVLTERIAYLLDNGVNKNEIIAFTFTKRAAKEMEYRLKKYEFENIYTFHGYCFKIFMQNKDELGYSKFDKIKIATDDYQYKIIDDILTNLKITYNQRVIKDYISKRKNEIKYNFKNIKEEALFNKIYFLFQEYMMRNGVLDYDDMLSIVANNINNLLFKDDLLEECKYILVDECQDTNQIQYKLIEKLSQKYNNIFMVGDEDQKIYSFRTSDIDIINEFKSSADEIIILNQNYRCASNILDKANHLISNNSNRENKMLFSNINPKFEIKYDDYQDTFQQAAFIASKIDTLISNGYKPNEIAVLFRNNNESNEIEYQLQKYHIPFTTYGKKKFFKYDETKRLIALYQFIYNPDDYINFRLAIPIDQAIYPNLIIEYKNSNKQFIDYLLTSSNERLQSYASKLKQIIDNLGSYTKDRLFDALVNILFEDIYTKNMNHLLAFKDLIVHNELDNEIDIINELMLNDDEKDIMGVNLMTIHKAKGLEFKCVFIISLNDGIIPSNLKDNNLLEEERRICYVGITRAKEYLYLSSAEYHIINGMRRRLRPSIFLSEIN